jgi:predicted enzyme related to lactoylglutathione lyase
MSEPVVHVHSVVINVLDYEAQKSFWGTVLGSDTAVEIEPHFVWFAPQREGGVQVALQVVETATDGPRRLHLDCRVDDVEAAAARIVELGGTHVADREMSGHRWTVMADPEGNEFCLGAG